MGRINEVVNSVYKTIKIPYTVTRFVTDFLIFTIRSNSYSIEQAEKLAKEAENKGNFEKAIMYYERARNEYGKFHFNKEARELDSKIKELEDLVSSKS